MIRKISPDPSFPKRGEYSVLFFVIFFSVFSLAAFNRNLLWGTEMRLWMDAASKSPLKGRTHTGIASALDMEGDMDGAMREYLIALRVDPGYYFPYAPLSVIYGKKGDLDTSIKLARLFLSHMPGDFKAHTTLAVAYVFKGMYKEAEEEYNEALKINPLYEVAKDGAAELKKLTEKGK